MKWPVNTRPVSLMGTLLNFGFPLCYVSVDWSCLLDEAFCCRLPDLSLSSAAGWLWGKNGTDVVLGVAEAVIGPVGKAE